MPKIHLSAIASYYTMIKKHQAVMEKVLTTQTWVNVLLKLNIIYLSKSCDLMRYQSKSNQSNLIHLSNDFLNYFFVPTINYWLTISYWLLINYKSLY